MLNQKGYVRRESIRRWRELPCKQQKSILAGLMRKIRYRPRDQIMAVPLTAKGPDPSAARPLADLIRVHQQIAGDAGAHQALIDYTTTIRLADELEGDTETAGLMMQFVKSCLWTVDGQIRRLLAGLAVKPNHVPPDMSPEEMEALHQHSLEMQRKLAPVVTVRRVVEEMLYRLDQDERRQRAPGVALEMGLLDLGEG